MGDTIHVSLDALQPPKGGLSELASARHAAPSNGKSFFIETFGCQMNDHDSEKVAGVLLGRGYELAGTPDAADIILYNTCSIREKAAQKVFSRLGLHHPRERFGGKVVGVLGCVAQQEGEEIFERAPWVSLVCGSASYRKLPDLLRELESGNRRVMGLDTDTDETFETEITRRDNPFRAYLTIIEGCDKACSYCVVPFTRGPERSRSSSSILQEVRQLADIGYTEVQFLGQTVNSYKDSSPRHMTFAELLSATAQVPGMRRVRFTTSHPNDFGRDIIQAIDAHPQLCEHIHLPVQSGSNKVLHDMRRTYTREEYLNKIEMIRAAKRPMSITSDIIVGFSTENEADFEETLSLLDIVQYDSTFAFKFSPRPNTAAQDMPDAVPEEEKSRRLQVLQDKQRQIQTIRNEVLAGQEFEVLVDNSHREGQWVGRTTSNKTINFASPASNLLGEYVRVRVTKPGPNSLVGELIGAPAVASS